MTTEIKICGLTDRIALETAIDAGADLAGIVFFPKSPRHLDMAQAAALADAGRGRITLVALTVNADDRLIDDIVATIKPDLLQFHGDESPQQVARTRERTGTGIIKAIGVSGAADLAIADEYSDVCHRLLLDAKPPRQADRPGGLGEVFDWTVLEDYEPGVPWLLAGGLRVDNVGRALAVSHAPGVDVSSGVESRPGVKDPEQIRKFIQTVRRHDADRAARDHQDMRYPA